MDQRCWQSSIIILKQDKTNILKSIILREDVKYYFADFVRKGGGEVPTKSVTPVNVNRNQVFFEQKTQFVALFEEKFSQT